MNNYNIINNLPLIKDLKEEIRKYLIPIAPLYGAGHVREIYVVDTYTGERTIAYFHLSGSLLTDEFNNHKAFFEWNVKLSNNYHSCNHTSYSSEHYIRSQTPCFWCCKQE